MIDKPPLPDHLWAKTPADAQAVILALVQSFERRIAALESRLNRNSSNSSRPPSAELLHAERQPPRTASRKRQGGQPGRERQTRELILAERLTGSNKVKLHCYTG